MIHPSKSIPHPDGRDRRQNRRNRRNRQLTPTAPPLAASAGRAPSAPSRAPDRTPRPAAVVGPAIGIGVDRRSGRWPYGGFALLPFVVDRAPGRPATDASWSWSLRRAARVAVWLLPGYAIVYGSVTLVGSGSAPFLVDPRPGYRLGWLVAMWLGALAVLAVTGLLVASRSRVGAAAGLVVHLAGMVLLVSSGGLPDAASAGISGQVIALAGGALYSLGWWLTGLALFRSGAFNPADGVLLMIAAPLLGAGGLLASALHSLGAMVVLAAGIGIAWRAARLVPPVARARLTRPATAGAVAAAVPVAGSVTMLAEPSGTS